MAKKFLLVSVMLVVLNGVTFSQEGNKPSPISIGVKATLDFSSDDDVQTGPIQVFGGHSYASSTITGTMS